MSIRPSGESADYRRGYEDGCAATMSHHDEAAKLRALAKQASPSFRALTDELANNPADAVREALEYDWDAAHEALESIDDCARMDVGVAPYGPYAVLRDLLTKAKGWKEQADRLAALAGAAPVASTETVKVEAGFVYENGIHTPTVLVSFNPNDWAARDQFVAKVKEPHAPAKAREDWQPMETLRNEYGNVWLANAENMRLAFWHEPDSEWLDYFKAESGEANRGLHFTPTHWRPLPKPPAALATFAEGAE